MAGGLGLCQARHPGAWQGLDQAHLHPWGEEQTEMKVEVRSEGVTLGVRKGLKYRNQKIRQSKKDTQRKMLTSQTERLGGQNLEVYLKKQDFLFYEC